jgi:biotin carboxyl carrier protein
MKKFKFTINGSQYDAEIVSIDENIAEVSVNGTLYTVEVDRSIPLSKTPKLVRTMAVPSTDAHPSTSKTSSPGAPKGTGTIKSPLPGVILELHVREGDAVKIGQKLITLEAMKMENNINADKEGKVISLKVGKGDSVMEGDVLLVIGD